MRLRGVNINCELMREAQLYSQLHGELQRELLGMAKKKKTLFFQRWVTTYHVSLLVTFI